VEARISGYGIVYKLGKIGDSIIHTYIKYLAWSVLWRVSKSGEINRLRGRVRGWDWD
jgi:hypothetical protein